MEIIEIIEKLNSELATKYNEWECQFSYKTNGYSKIVEILDVVLWNSEDDTRDFVEYDGMESYLRQKYNDLCLRLFKQTL